MAYQISDFNGTVIAPDADYPRGSIKDAPSGTLVDRVMMTDIIQFFQKAMADSGITPNGLPDNVTNEFQLFYGVQGIANAYARALIINQLGESYSSSTVYVMSGAGTAATAGILFYNGEVYYYSPNPSSCVHPATTILTIQEYTTNGLKTIKGDCGTSGAGLVDYSGLVHYSGWIDFTPVFGSGAGGTITVDPADIKYARYKIMGKTCFVQVRVETITVSSAPASISMTLPFLSSGAFANPGHYTSGGFYAAPSGATKQTLWIEFTNGTPAVNGYPSTGFVAGTDDSNVYFDFVFELV